MKHTKGGCGLQVQKFAQLALVLTSVKAVCKHVKSGLSKFPHANQRTGHTERRGQVRRSSQSESFAASPCCLHVLLVPICSWGRL